MCIADGGARPKKLVRPNSYGLKDADTDRAELLSRRSDESEQMVFGPVLPQVDVQGAEEVFVMSSGMYVHSLVWTHPHQGPTQFVHGSMQPTCLNGHLQQEYLELLGTLRSVHDANALTLR